MSRTQHQETARLISFRDFLKFHYSQSWVKNVGNMPGFLGCSIYDACYVNPAGNNLGCSPRERLLRRNLAAQSVLNRIIEQKGIFLLLWALCYHFCLESCHYTPSFLQKAPDRGPCVPSQILQWLSMAWKVTSNSFIRYDPSFASLSPDTTHPHSLFVSQHWSVVPSTWNIFSFSIFMAPQDKLAGKLCWHCEAAWGLSNHPRARWT